MYSGFFVRHRPWHAAHDALREGEDALVRGRATPAQGKRDVGFAIDQVERGEVRADRGRELVGIDRLFADIGRLQHLQIAPRQQRARIGDGAGVPGELHAVFGSTERGRTDALAGGKQRPRQRAGVEPLAQRLAEAAAHVAEIAILAAIDVFGDAAGHHDAVDAAKLGDRLGEIELGKRRGQGPHLDRREQCVGHVERDLVERRGVGAVALIPVEPGLRGVVLAGRIEPGDDAALIHHLQSPADMDGRRRDHAALLQQRQLGGAAADVDVEDALALVGRDARCAGAIGRQHRLHVMAGGGADELAALLRQHSGDRLRVVASQRFAGQDHHAGVNVVRRDAGAAVGLLDDGAQRGVVDALFALVGRQRHRRAIQRLAVDDEIAAGEVFAHPAQLDPGENHLRARRADVDADARQRDVVLQPERIVFERPVVEVVMIVISIAVVNMGEVGAKLVIGQRVGIFWVFGVGHAPNEYSKTGPRRSPFATQRMKQHYHFWLPYQSSMSLRT